MAKDSVASQENAKPGVRKTQKLRERPEILDTVLDDYKLAHDYAASYYHGLWEDCWKLYNNQRVKIGYESVADTFVPMTFQAIEQILGAIAGGKPRFVYLPTNPAQAQDTKILNAIADYFWDLNDLSIKVIPWVRDSLLYGTGVIFGSWEIDHFEAKNIPLKDFFVDPAATRLENAKYAGYRYLSTREALSDAQTVDIETGDIVPLYKNLDQLTDESAHADLTDKEQKDLYLGSTLGKNAASKQVECIYYITPKRLVVVANRSVVIRDEDNPYYKPQDQSGPEIKGFLPFAVQRNYIDPALFYAKGDVEPIIDAQELLNDTANQKIDNISYVLDNMWALDPAYAHLKDEIESVPGGVITAPKGAIEPIDKPVVTQAADEEMARLKQEILDATGAAELSPGAGRMSATQVSYRNSLAKQRFSMKLATLENEGFKQLADMMFKMAQIFVDAPMAVRIVGPNGTEWKDFDATEYQGEYEPRVQLDANAKADKEQTAAQFQNLYQILLANPMINQQELLSLLLDKVFDLDQTEASSLLSVPPPSGAPHPPEKLIESINYKDAPPDVQRQMEAEAGFQPSQIGLPVGTIPLGGPMGHGEPHPALPLSGAKNQPQTPPGNLKPTGPAPLVGSPPANNLAIHR